MQRNVDNGDVSASKRRREFNLLAVDERHLDATALKWETSTCDGRRWLLIHDYPLLPGYIPSTVRLAWTYLRTIRKRKLICSTLTQL
jgi:hypothetical protein